MDTSCWIEQGEYQLLTSTFTIAGSPPTSLVALKLRLDRTGQLNIAPLYELTEDQLVEAAIKQSGHCNLQACRITSGDVIALAQTMKYHPLISSIDLRDNQLDDMAALALAESVAATGKPTSIDFRKNRITDVGGQALLDSVNLVPALTNLNLEGNELSTELLSQIQAIIAVRKKAAPSPALAPTIPTPALASSSRLAPRPTATRSSSDLDQDDRWRKKKSADDEDDLSMDLGFDSEIRGRKTPESKSVAALSKKHSMMDDSFPADNSMLSTSNPLSPVLPIPSDATHMTATSSHDPNHHRRSSFSEALHAASDQNASGGFDDFDWGEADTAGLLDATVPPPSAGEPHHASVPSYQPTTTTTAPIALPSKTPPPIQPYDFDAIQDEHPLVSSNFNAHPASVAARPPAPQPYVSEPFLPTPLPPTTTTTIFAPTPIAQPAPVMNEARPTVSRTPSLLAATPPPVMPPTVTQPTAVSQPTTAPLVRPTTPIQQPAPIPVVAPPVITVNKPTPQLVRPVDPLPPPVVPAPSSAADDFDEFNFDDSHDHFDLSSGGGSSIHPSPLTSNTGSDPTTATSTVSGTPATGPVAAPMTSAVAPTPVAVATKQSHPQTPQDGGLLDQQQLSGEQPIIEDDWSKGIKVLPPTPAAAASSSSSDFNVAASSTKPSQSEADDDELAQAQAKMRAQIEASNALAQAASSSTHSHTQSATLAPPNDLTPTLTPPPNQPIHSHSQSVPVTFPTFPTFSGSASSSGASTPGVAAPPPFVKPTLLPPSPSLWNSDPSDPSSTRINLSGNPLDAIQVVLPQFQRLRSLRLNECGITRLPPLPQSIEQLDLALNELTSFDDALMPCQGLLELNVAINHLQNLDGLANNTLLKFLNLSDNGLKSITGLAHLKLLQSLDLRMNALSNLSGLRELSLNTSLKVLRIEGNPLLAAFPSAPARGGSAAIVGAQIPSPNLKLSICSFLPYLVQLDSQIFVLNPLDILGFPVARNGASLLMDVDLIDVMDLYKEIRAQYTPAVKRFIVRVSAGERGAAPPTVGGKKPEEVNDRLPVPATEDPTVLITTLMAHLTTIQFIPYFLPDIECKVLLSLLSSSTQSKPGAPRVNERGFCEFLARAACYKQMMGPSGGTPIVIKNFQKALREHAAKHDGELYRAGYLNELFLASPNAPISDDPNEMSITQTPSYAWVYANYALKLLGLMAPPPGAGHKYARSTSASRQQFTTTPVVHKQISPPPAPVPPPKPASVKKKKVRPVSMDASMAASPSASSSTTTAANDTSVNRTVTKSPTAKISGASERLYPKPTPKVAPAPVAAATLKATPIRGASGSTKKPTKIPTPSTGAASSTLNMDAQVNALLQARVEEQYASLIENDPEFKQALKKSLKNLTSKRTPKAATATALDETNESIDSRAATMDLATYHALQGASSANESQTSEVGNDESTLPDDDGVDYDDAHYLPAHVAAASNSTGPKVGGGGGIESTLSPHHGKIQRAGGGGAASGLSGLPQRRGGGNSGRNSDLSSDIPDLDDDSWLDDVDVSTARGIKRIIKNLNEKINKLYNWHLVEVESITKQQELLISLKTDIETRSNGSATPIHQNLSQSLSASGPLIFEPFSPAGSQSNQPTPQRPQQQHFALPNPTFSPAAHHSMNVSSAPSPSPGASASSEDWASLMQALSVLEQTDPNCAEVHVLRELLKQEHMQAHVQAAMKTQPIQAAQQQFGQQSMQQQQPPQQQMQFATSTPIQSQPQQMSYQPAPTPTAAPSPAVTSGSFTPTSFVSYPPQVTVSAPAAPIQTPSTSNPSAPITAESILASFWLSDIQEWAHELDEELKTATMALSNILDLTSQSTSPEEYAKSIRDFEHILSISGMLVSFGLPSHVAAMLTILPPELLVSIRGSAHRLEATKKSLHSFLALVHAETPNSPLVQELRFIITQSGVTSLPASTLEEMARLIAGKMAQQQQQQQQAQLQLQQQQQQQQFLQTAQSSPTILVKPTPMFNNSVAFTNSIPTTNPTYGSQSAPNSYPGSYQSSPDQPPLASPIQNQQSQQSTPGGRGRRPLNGVMTGGVPLPASSRSQSQQFSPSPIQPTRSPSATRSASQDLSRAPAAATAPARSPKRYSSSPKRQQALHQRPKSSFGGHGERF